METINIRLAAFEGPLDLLYHLIEKNEIDIYDIPIEPFVVTIQKAVFTESLPFVYLLWHLPAFLSIIFFRNDAYFNFP